MSELFKDNTSFNSNINFWDTSNVIDMSYMFNRSFLFNQEISKFNNHYEAQVNILKNNILNKILEILKKYSLNNKIDLILDSNNYILSSNSINITDLIIELSNEKKIEMNFEKY